MDEQSHSYIVNLSYHPISPILPDSRAASPDLSMPSVEHGRAQTSSQARQSAHEGQHSCTNELKSTSDGLLAGMSAKRNSRGPKLPWNLKLELVAERYWITEATSWLLSIGLLSTIAGILARYDGRNLPQWPLDITLSALVSVLATVATFAMIVPVAAGMGQLKWAWFSHHNRPLSDFQVIEDASKGPFGSTKLLAKGKGGFLALVGAAITVLILAVNPFVQQVIEIDSRPVNSTRAYLPAALRYQSLGNTYDSDSIEADLSMKGAIMSGLLNYNALANLYDVDPECNTSNCTWPEHQSLAVCSSCQDLGTYLTSKRTDNNTSTIISLPNGLSIKSIDEYQSTGLFSMALNSSGLPQYTAKDPGTVSPPTIPSIAFANFDPSTLLLDTFAIIGPYNVSDYWNDYIYGHISPYSAECILYFCTRSLTAKVENNIFNEMSVADPTALSASAQNYSNTVDWTTDGLYTVSEYARSALVTYLNGVFSGCTLGLVASESLQSSFPNTWSSDPTQAVFRALNSTNNTLDHVMSNVAKSMTSNMRIQDGTNMLVAGHATINQAYVKIRWLWMILPLTINALVLAFMLAVSLSAASAGTEAWKDNTLVTLFHGLDDETRHRTLQWRDDNNARLTDAAEQVMVRLEKDSGDWRLQQSSTSTSAMA